jgi:hypothetical protein
MQQTSAWVTFGDQAGEHGGEPGQQHCAQDHQQRRRIYLAGVRPEHLGQMLAAFFKLGIDRDQGHHDDPGQHPGDCRGRPQRTQARSVAGRSARWSGLPRCVPIAYPSPHCLG